MAQRAAAEVSTVTMDQQAVPIASLSPDLRDPSSKAIRAIVTLLWPYSSATRSSSLLLADPDFRLRRNKGQVRVYLQGAAAKAVAESRIGIGDEVLLSLQGAQWREDSSETDAISTPGKNVEWELVFRRRIVIQISRDGQEHATVDLDQRNASPERESSEDAFATPGPVPKERLAHSTPNLFWKHGRLSGDSLTFSPYDPFTTRDDGTAKRLRRSWNDVESWKLSRRPPSPTKDHDPFGINDESSDHSADLATFNGQQDRMYHTTTSRHDASAERSASSKFRLYEAGPPRLDGNSDFPHANGQSSAESGSSVLAKPSQPVLFEEESSQDSQRISKQISQHLADFGGDTEPEDDDVIAAQAARLVNSRNRPFSIFQDKQQVSHSLFSAEAAPLSVNSAASNIGTPGMQTGTLKKVTPTSRMETNEIRGSQQGTESDVQDHEVRVDTTTPLQKDNFNRTIALSELEPPDPDSATHGGTQDEPILLGDSDEDEDPGHGEEDEGPTTSQMNTRTDRSSVQYPNIYNAASNSEALPSSELESMMPPPNLPTLRLRTASNADDKPHGQTNSAPKTPELKGVASPTLPLPSPFPATNEAMVTSFLDVKPQRPPRERRVSAPKTIRETLEEEKFQLQVPRKRARRSRTSSSSSHRRESGPFAEHVRAAKAFGHDKTSMLAEEAVVDSPEIEPIKRDVPGLRTLASLSDLATDQGQETAGQSRRHPMTKLTEQAAQQFEEPHMSNWLNEEWLEPKSMLFDEALLSSVEAPVPATITASAPGDLTVPNIPSSPTLEQDPTSTRQQATTIIELDSGSSEIGDDGSTTEEQPVSHGSYSVGQASAMPASSSQFGSQLSATKTSPLQYRAVEASAHLEDGSFSAKADSWKPPELSTGVTEAHPSPLSEERDGFQPTLSLQSETSLRDLSWQHGIIQNDANNPQPLINSDLGRIDYPELPSSPRILSNLDSFPRNLTQPATSEVHTYQQFAPLTPEMTQKVQPSQSFDKSGPEHGVFPPTSLQTQEAIQSSPIKKTRHERRRSQRLSGSTIAPNPWFTPSRKNAKSTQPQTEHHEAAESSLGVRHSISGVTQKPVDDEVSGTVHEQSSNTDISLVVKAKERLIDLSQQLNLNATQSQSSQVKTAKNGHPNGLRTSLSYYTPLHSSHLRPHLNSSSQHENTIDVLAVISSPPSLAKRADKGPKDWHKNLSLVTPDSISDREEWSNGEVHAQCFMRGKNGRDLLPKADPGDIILLRDFNIVSEKSSLALINRNRGSGWCVWRFGGKDMSKLSEETGSHDSLPSRVHLPPEEMLGAPVEIGDEERQEAERLRNWWDSRPQDIHNGSTMDTADDG